MHLCVLYGSQNKQRLFSSTTLAHWLLEPRRSVFTARYELIIWIYFTFKIIRVQYILDAVYIHSFIHGGINNHTKHRVCTIILFTSLFPQYVVIYINKFSYFDFFRIYPWISAKDVCLQSSNTCYSTHCIKLFNLFSHFNICIFNSTVAHIWYKQTLLYFSLLNTSLRMTVRGRNM